MADPRRAIGKNALTDRLLAAGLSPQGLEQARKRQKIYGGGLDTVLLELGLIEEPALLAVLCEETRLPPLPPALRNGPVIPPEMLLDAAAARRFGALAFRVDPVHSAVEPPPGRPPEQPITAQAIARLGFDVGGLANAIGDRPAQVFIVPEVRFEALLGSFFSSAVPSRFLSLLGRLGEPQQIRRAPRAGSPETGEVAAPLVELGPQRRAPRTRKASNRPAPTVPPPRAPTPPPPRAPTPPPPRAPAPPPPQSAPALEVEIEIESAPPPAVTGHDLHALAATFFEVAGGPRAAPLESSIVAQFSLQQVLAALPTVLPFSADPSPAGPAASDPRLGHWLALIARYGDPARQALLDLLSGSHDLRWRIWAAHGLALIRTDRPPVEDEVADRLCVALDRERDERLREALLRALRPRLGCAATSSLRTRLHDELASEDADRSRPAIAALCILRDREAVEPLVERLGSRDRTMRPAIRAVLADITGHDAGATRAPWLRWWKAHRDEHRIEWLITALADKDAQRRAFALDELRGLTGQTFGYHFDLPRSQRNAARARWIAWWQTEGRARHS